MKFSQILKKVISSALILTFSYTQLLWAGPRDLQAAAKSFFDEESQRRGMAAEDFAAQGSNQAAVDHQNLLQSLEGPQGESSQTFSLTTENGDILKYVGDTLSQVQRPNGGPLLTNLDIVGGTIQNATLNFLDGSIQEFTDGKINEYTTPDGTKVEYDLQTGKITQTTKDGKITKYDHTGDDLVLTTYPDASLNPETILYIAIYGPNNKLKSVEDKTKHTTTFYTNGILERILKEDGTQIIFQQEILSAPTEDDPLATQIKVTFEDYLDAEGNSLLEDPTEMTLPDGSTLRDIVWDDATQRATGGILQSTDGNAYTFINSAIESITIPGGSVLTQLSWDGDTFQGGKLRDLDNNIFNYLNGVLSTIDLEDTSLIEEMVWDEDGLFISGTLTDSNDNKFIFENGIVVRIELKDSYVIETITWNGSSIQACTLTKDGNTTHYANGSVTSIDLSDGSTFTDTVFNSDWEFLGGLLTSGNNQYRFQDRKLIRMDLNGQVFENIVWSGGHVIEVTHDNHQFKFEDGKLIQVTSSGNVFTVQDGAITAVTTSDGVWRDIDWNEEGRIQGGLLDDETYDNRYTFDQDGDIAQVRLSDGSVMTDISWDQGHVQSALLTDPEGNEFHYENENLSWIGLEDGSRLEPIEWLDGILQDARLTDAGNEFTFENGLITKIELQDGTIIQNIAWNSSDHTIQSAVIMIGDDSYTYEDKKLISSTISGEVTDYRYFPDRIEVVKNNVTYAYLTDRSLYKVTQPDGSYVTFNTGGPYKGLKDKEFTPQGILTALYQYETIGTLIKAQRAEPLSTLINTTTIQGTANLSITSSTKPSFKFTAFFPEGDLIDQTVKASATASGKNFNINLVPGTGSTWGFASTANLGLNLRKNVLYNVEITWLPNKSAVIFVWDATQPKPTTPQASITTQQANWKPKFQAISTNANISLLTGSTGAYTTSSSVQDKLQGYQPQRFFQKTDFKFNSASNTNKIVLTATQAKVGSITRTLTLTWQSGKWTLSRKDNSSAAVTSKVNQTLTQGVEYTAELEFQGTKANLYVYQKGQARPATPTGSLDIFNASTKLQSTFTNAVTTSAQILKNISNPTVSSLQGPTLTDRMDTLENMTMTERQIPSVTQKDIAFTAPASISKPDWTAVEQTVSDLSATPIELPVFSGLGNALLTPNLIINLSEPQFTVTKKVIDVTKPVIELPEEAQQFEEMIYNEDATLKELRQSDGTLLEFDNGILTKVTDITGEVITASFQPPSDLGNLTGVTITEEGGPVSSYDADGELSSLRVSEMTIHYAGGDPDFIEKTDGTILSDLRFSGTALLDAKVLTPQGEKLTYEEGRLKNILKPDDSILEFELNEEGTENELRRLILNPEVIYEFTYVTPEIREANLITPVPDALTIIKMVYDGGLNLKKAIRQNQEIIEYAEDHKISKIIPGPESSQVFEHALDGSYTVTQGEAKSFYDKFNVLEKVMINSSENNPYPLEVSYRYGKIKDIKKGVNLTFEYSYTTDENGIETTLIKDLEEDVDKTYKDELLTKSVDNKTGVLSTYSYNSDRSVSRVVLKRLNKTLHTYDYTYPDGPTGNTVVRDTEENITRTYGAISLQAVTLKEEAIKNDQDEIVLDNDGNILGYTFTQTDELSPKILDRQLLKLEKEGSVFTYTYSQQRMIDKDGHETLSEIMTQEELVQKTFEDQSVAEYKDGKLLKMTLNNGSIITDVEANDDRTLKKAAITLTTGIKKIFDQNTLLEEVLTDGNHLYYEDGRISKLIRPDGKEFTYTYEKDSDGNILFAWVKTGAANLKYDPTGRLIGLKVGESGDLDEILEDVTYTSQGSTTTLNSELARDGDPATAFSTQGTDSFSGGSGRAHNSSVTLISQYNFPSAVTLDELSYQFDSSAWSKGNTNNRSHCAWSLQYALVSSPDTWTTIPGYGSNNSHDADRNTNFEYTNASQNSTASHLGLENVIAVRLYLDAGGGANEFGEWGMQASINEFSFKLLDKAYFSFSVQKDASETVTGYSFQGPGGEILYDAQSALVSVSPVSEADPVMNTALNEAAQSLKDIIGTLPELPFIEKMNAEDQETVYEMGRLRSIQESGEPSQTFSRKIVGGQERILVSDTGLIREYDLEGNLLGVSLPGMKPEPIDGSKGFINYESAKSSITSYGEAHLSTQGMPQGNGYAAFDGQGDYLALPDSPDWTAENVTLNFKIRADTLEDGLGIVGHYQDSSNLWALDWSGNNLRFYQYENGTKTIDIQNSWTPFPSMWNELTLQKTGNEYKMFVNGVQVGTTQTSAVALKDFNGELWIGRNPRDTGRYLNGAIDDLSLTSDSETKLLLNFDGIDRSYYKFEKETDAEGVLTGYSLKGDSGEFHYDPAGALLTSSFNDIVHQFQNGYKVTFIPTIADEVPPSFYGDGRDGDITISSNTILNRNMYYNSLTIDPGAVLNPNGYKIFVKGALVNNGIISANGTGGSGGVGGIGAHRTNTVILATAGTAGGSQNYSLGGQATAGTAGQAWSTVGGAGGGSGTVTLLSSIPSPIDLGSDLSPNLGGGAGGGGGGGGAMRDWSYYSNHYSIAGGNGGAGGAGGGAITIFADRIDSGSGTITANGFLGAAGLLGAFLNNDVRGATGGNGGNGGGGVIYLVSNSLSAGKLSASGGTNGFIQRYEMPKTENLALPSLLMPHLGSYDLTNIQNPGKADWIDKASDSILDAETIVFQEYTTKGALETQSKADGTVTVFDEQNRPYRVLDTDGTILIEYTYDLDGNPSRVFLKNARDTLPDEVDNSKLTIEENRAEIIRQIAIDHDSTKQTIKDTYAPELQKLKDQLTLLDDAENDVSGTPVQGKQARAQKSDILGQISAAKEQIQAAFIELLRTERNLLLANDDLATQRSTQIQNETDQALVSLAEQERTLKREILRQEVSPIVYDYYRRILGRDPSQVEYDEWIDDIDYDSGENGSPVKTIDGEDLTSALNRRVNDSSAQSELSQRSTYVQHVKDRVDQKVRNFLSDATLRADILNEVGLTDAELVHYESAEDQERDFGKILEWLSSRSNHFGQSASLSLEALLEQHNLIQDETGSTPLTTREEILEKLILIDILTGIITPLDDGDLVISVFALNKVADLYGLDLTGAKLDWNNLRTIYETNPQAQIIAHINGNHFVVIRSVTEGEISYMDPGAGADKENDVVTVSKKEFLKVWDGNVTLESSQYSVVGSQGTARLLSLEETQKIRGAFFPLLFAAVFAAIVQIGAAVYAVLSAIGAIVAGIASFVGGLIANIGVAIGGIIHGIGQALYMGIKFAVSTLFKVAGWVGTHMSQAVVGSVAKASFGQTLFHTVVNIGVNFGVQKGLESIGVNPVVARFASAFLTAGTNSFFDPQNAFTWGHFIQEGFKGVALVGSQDLLVRIGVDPGLASILSLVTSPFIDGIQVGNVGGELVNIIPQFTQSLAFYGIQKLGELAGLDPMVATLIGAPISAVIGGVGFEQGKTWGENAMNAINTGILRGATSLGIEYLTQEADLDPLLGSLTSRAITGAIEGALGGNIFEGVFNAFKDSALNVARLGVSGNDSWSQAQYLQRVINFSDIIEEKGFAQAIEDSAAQILHEDAVSSILQTINPLTNRLFSSIGEFIQDAIDRGKFERIEANSQFFRELEIKPGHSLRATDDFKSLARIGRGDEVLDATYGGSFGKVEDEFGAIGANHLATIGDEFNSYELFERIENGQQAYAEIRDSSGDIVLVISPNELGGYNTFDSYGDYVAAKIASIQDQFVYQMDSGNLNNFSIYDPETSNTLWDLDLSDNARLVLNQTVSDDRLLNDLSSNDREAVEEISHKLAELKNQVFHVDPNDYAPQTIQGAIDRIQIIDDPGISQTQKDRLISKLRELELIPGGRPDIEIVWFKTQSINQEFFGFEYSSSINTVSKIEGTNDHVKVKLDLWNETNPSTEINLENSLVTYNGRNLNLDIASNQSIEFNPLLSIFSAFRVPHARTELASYWENKSDNNRILSSNLFTIGEDTEGNTIFSYDSKAHSGSIGEFTFGPNMEIKIPYGKIKDGAALILAATLVASLAAPIEAATLTGAGVLTFEQAVQNALARAITGS